MYSMKPVFMRKTTSLLMVSVLNDVLFLERILLAHEFTRSLKLEDYKAPIDPRHVVAIWGRWPYST